MVVQAQFKSMRYDEDYTALKDDTTQSAYKRLKYTPLNMYGGYLSFGGEVRYQYFMIANGAWGDEPDDADGYSLTRFLAHADVHLTKNFRAFIQLQASGANGKPDTSPVDENPLDVHQAFADYTGKISTASFIVRAGRQEMSYGSQRLISVRELPNNRQAFDAVKVVVAARRRKLDVLYGDYVYARKNIFDDDPSGKAKLWGIYVALAKFSVLQNVEVYYLGLQKLTARFDDGQGKETRHSIGTRVSGQQRGWRYDGEGLFQFGDLQGKTIRAWTASVNMGYKWNDAFLQPELGLKSELISGDKTNGDARLQTFNPLFPRGAYFGLAALIGPANLVDIHPSLAITYKQLTLTTDYDRFWRQSPDDGIYAPNMELIYSGRHSSARLIGQQITTEIQYAPSGALTLKGEYTFFNAGHFLKDVGTGKDIHFGGVTVQYKF
ncbi:alginate export family protein [Chryseolinea sp. Jin1]|uniref:Alginate export family protein n=2 Tax=Chryseolinea lacunae TaxID=2801331 RepID=A0ABS1KRN9_9BACT|nr:alginate export family protein [Chryseolinea lacunae]